MDENKKLAAALTLLAAEVEKNPTLDLSGLLKILQMLASLGPQLAQLVPIIQAFLEVFKNFQPKKDENPNPVFH